MAPTTPDDDQAPGEPRTSADVLGPDYTRETIPLPADAEGTAVATLVRRAAVHPTDRAVLHVHGFADYFFQTVAADFWVGRGYDFYALDLRRHGRSLLDHQTPNFTTDLGEYYAELDAAWRRITRRDGHDRVVVSAHSTGGLVTSLWAHDTAPPGLCGMVLNSPWLDLDAGVLARTVGTRALHRLGALRPYATMPRKVSGAYAESLHRDHRGEWDFDLAWKPLRSWPVYAGWLRAVRRGHARVHAGIDVGVPVLVLTSGASLEFQQWDEAVHTHDVVLDVERIRRWAPMLGDHVTLVRVQGARHDVTLSLRPARERVFAEITRWLAVYVQPDPGSAGIG